MATLPEEILLNHILPLLPLLPSKSLVRFTCVCKSWHSFIHHPSFLFLRRNNHHHLLFLSHDPQASVIPTSQPHLFSAPFHNSVQTPPRATLLFTLPTKLNFSGTRVQCVKGLLCFHPRSSSTWFSSSDSAFTLIANPTTRHILTLPLDHSIGNREFLVSTHFGYDPVGDQFKVLRLVKYRGSHEFQIFTLGGDDENSWRVVTPDRPFMLMLCLLYGQRGLCVNGTIYWIYSTTPMNPSFSIVAFDVGTEQFKVMPSPSGYSSYVENVSQLPDPDLVEIDGCLSLIGNSGSVLKMWILKDCEAQVWEQKSIVLPDGIVAKEQVVFPLCIVHTGEILLLPHILPRRVRGIYYDMEKMSCRSVVVMEMPQPLWPDERSGELDIFFCEESFRLLN